MMLLARLYAMHASACLGMSADGMSLSSVLPVSD